MLFLFSEVDFYLILLAISLRKLKVPYFIVFIFYKDRQMNKYIRTCKIPHSFRILKYTKQKNFVLEIFLKWIFMPEPICFEHNLMKNDLKH